MAIPAVSHRPPDVAGLRVGVVGAARSGVGCARLLTGAGAAVVVGDAKPEVELDAECVRQIAETGAELHPSLTGLARFGPLDMLVVSPGVPVDAPVAAEARKAGLQVLGEVELAYRFSRAPVIAVTGTNAKGTTCTLLGDMLNEGGVKARVCGNIGDPFSGAVAEGEPFDLYVVEVSSFQLETIDTLRPWIALLLNIEPDHLDRHRSFEDYLAAKARLFENQTPSDWAILRGGDSNVARAAASGRSRRILFSATSPDGQGRLENASLVVDVRNGPVHVCTTDDLVRPGRPYIESVLAASAAALLVGVGPECLLRAIRGHKLPDHVLEAVCEAYGVTFINSSKATNPAAARADIESVEGPLLVIAGGLEKNADFADFASLLRQRAKAAFLIGECAGRIAKAAVGVPVTHCSTLDEAVEEAFRTATRGDTVMLAPACASLDMFPNYRVRGDRFREIAQQLCREAKGARHQEPGGPGQP
jgi:UDP-N-acetylmuramoylalanine--D-glutamate ligase